MSVASASAYALFAPNGSLPLKLFFLNLWSGWIVGAVHYELTASRSGTPSPRMWLFSGLAVLSLAIAMSYLGRRAPGLSVFAAPLDTVLWAWPVGALLMFLDRDAGVGRISSATVRLFATIGVFSYSLAVLHEPLIQARNLLQARLPSGPITQATEVMWFFVILLVSWISYRYVEQSFRRKRLPILSIHK